ncbi:MAG: hypothetical protein R3F48_09980 [Candidatus Zixiibacteriota bacterium]
MDYIVNFTLDGHTLKLLAIIVSTIAAYFALLSHLNNGITSDKKIPLPLKTGHFELLHTARKNLLRAAYFAILPLILIKLQLLAYIFFPAGHDYITHFSAFLIYIITLSSILGMAYTGFLIEKLIYRLRQEEIKETNHKIDAALYLGTGRGIKGRILNLQLVNGSELFNMIDDKFNITTFSWDNVAALFLQKNYRDVSLFKDAKYNEHTRKFRMRSPYSEEFPYSKYFERANFKVLRINKPTTHSYFAIINHENLYD